MKIFYNIFLLALKIEILLSESYFKIFSLFIQYNNMRFDIIDFIKSSVLMYLNYN